MREGTSDVVSCGAYADMIIGSTEGLCKEASTGSYCVVWDDADPATGPMATVFEVIECNDGVPTVHVCISNGCVTTDDGYNDVPGYVCT